MISQAVSSSTFQRKLHKICHNWTTFCIVNLVCFQIVGTSLLRPHLVRPWPSSWLGTLAGSLLDGVLVPSRFHFFPRWERKEVCPEDFFWLHLIWLSSEGAGRPLEHQTDSWCPGLSEVSPALPWGREMHAWNEAWVHPISLHVQSGDMETSCPSELSL